MGRRGRRSAADTAVIIKGTFGERPSPPDILTERQAEIWREVVSSEHSDFFSSAALRGMLSDYVRHRECGENISNIINSFDPLWLKSADGAKRYYDLLKMRDLETRAAAGLATKLRITNQSRYNALSAGTAARSAAKGPRPWEE